MIILVAIQEYFLTNKKITTNEWISMFFQFFQLGIFSNSHIPYHHQIREGNLDVPTLKEMTVSAIKNLRTGPNGFFLLVSN